MEISIARLPCYVYLMSVDLSWLPSLCLSHIVTMESPTSWVTCSSFNYIRKSFFFYVQAFCSFQSFVIVSAWFSESFRWSVYFLFDKYLRDIPLYSPLCTLVWHFLHSSICFLFILASFLSKGLSFILIVLICFRWCISNSWVDPQLVQFSPRLVIDSISRDLHIGGVF